MDVYFKEDFLHYIWKYRLYKISDLYTTDGEYIQILKTGENNLNSGPDFFNAKIKIDDTVWAGNIEIHIKSSDWIKHNHNKDENYNNIILHVVFINDNDILRLNGEKIPCLELKNYISLELHNNYKNLLFSYKKVPCENNIKNIDNIILRNWIDRLLVERIELKTKDIEQTLTGNNFNWEETLYYLMAKGFGIKINQLPFELLAKSVSLKVIAKHKDSHFQIEAMLFGQAGMLNQTFNDLYAQQLFKEYLYLKQKFNLIPLNNNIWSFSKLRPPSFPTIRISQFAALIFKSNALFSKIINSNSYEEIYNLLNVKSSEYWANHYDFDKKSKRCRQNIGEETINSLIINVIVPIFFIYGKLKDDKKYIDKSLELLEFIPSENNSIIKYWSKILNKKFIYCFESQAIIQLYNNYCLKKRCLECSIGVNLLK